MTRTMRWYQSEDVDTVYRMWGEGVTRLALVWATGLGKTDSIAKVATDGVAEDPDGWVLVAAHRRRLLAQITARCAMYNPDVTVGVVQGQAKNQVRRQIVVASEPTLRRPNRRAQLLAAHRDRRPRRVIVDECHHAAAPGYRELLAWAGCFDEHNPTPLLGVTATLMRANKRDGLGDVFADIAAERDIMFGIDNGYLVMPYGREVVGEHVELSRVKTGADGDYAKGALGEMVEQDAKHIVKAWLEEAVQPESPLGYRTTVAFTPSVKAAEALCAEYVGAGIPAAIITGAMSEKEQDARYDELESGAITVLCSVMVPTEGWDCPRVSCVVNARPTKFPGLYAQMIGRGLRLWLEALKYGCPPKVDCLVLDVVGASSRNRLTNLVELVPSAKVDTTERDIIPCPECGGYRVQRRELIEQAIANGIPFPCECDRVERDAGSGRRLLQGPGVYGDVDLLGLRACSDLNWLTTPGGVNFLSAGKWLIAIVPDTPAEDSPTAPTFSVGYCPVWGGAVNPEDVIAGTIAPNRRGVTLTEGVPFTEARQAAEWLARKYDAHGKDAPWRSARKSPSSAQTRLALSLDIPHPELWTSGGLSDAIDIARATARFD